MYQYLKGNKKKGMLVKDTTNKNYNGKKIGLGDTKGVFFEKKKK